MATGAVHGRRGRLLLGNTSALSTSGGSMFGIVPFSEVRNWRIDPTQEMIDASSADSSGWNEFIAGQRGWTFTAETVFAPKLAVGTGGAAQDINNLLRRFFSATDLRLYFFELAVDVAPLSTGPAATQRWRSGSTTGLSTAMNYKAAFIENWRVGGSYNDLQIFDLTLRGVGTLSYSS